MLVKKKLKIWENRKKIGFISVFMILLLALVKGMGSSAEEMELEGVVFTLEDGYYKVESAEQIRILGQVDTNDKNSKFKLMNDIEVTEVNEAAISTFAGEFDGQDYKITYHKIEIATDSGSNEKLSFNEGILFGTVSGEIKNLFVEIGSVDYTFKDTYQPELVENSTVKITPNQGDKFLDPEIEKDREEILGKIKIDAYDYDEGAQEYVKSAGEAGVDKNDPETEQIYYYKQELYGTVSKENIGKEKKKKTVYFGLVGTIGENGSINNLQIEGEGIAAATVENEYCYEISYEDQNDVDMSQYYEVAYTGKLLTKKVEEQNRFAYQYATEDGEEFNFDIPLYSAEGQALYQQFEDEDGIFWFRDGEQKDISLVYDNKYQKGRKHVETKAITKVVTIENRYAYLYATNDGDNFDYSKPLYEAGKPIYEQFEEEDGEFWFFEQDGGEKKKVSLVYETRANMQKEKEIDFLVTTKGQKNQYVYQYATQDGDIFDFGKPLYINKNKPIYGEAEKDGESWFFDEEAKEYISLKYENRTHMKTERTVKCKVIEKIEGGKRYAYQYAADGDIIYYEIPLYGEEDKPIYKQYVNKDGESWFINTENEEDKYPVYDTEGMEVRNYIETKVLTKSVLTEEKYAYQYATMDGKEFDFGMPLYKEDGEPVYEQEEDEDGIPRFFKEEEEGGIFGFFKRSVKTYISLVYDSEGEEEQIQEEIKEITKEVLVEKKYAYQYATLDGDNFDYSKPLYENGKAIYEQEEDETGVFWFFTGEGEEKERISLVYETRDEKKEEREVNIEVTKKVRDEDKYVYQYATEDGDTFDFNKPLYIDRMPIYEGPVIKDDEYWFFIENEEDYISLVYETRDHKQEERTITFKVLEMVEREVETEFETEERYAYQYATEDGETFDYSKPLYEAGVPKYKKVKDEDGELWFLIGEGEGNETMSLVYETGNEDQDEREGDIVVTKKAEAGEEYIFRYATKDGETFDFSQPLYRKDGTPEYEKEEHDGRTWFFTENDTGKTYISHVYETREDMQQERTEKIKVVKKIKVEIKYAYQYATEDGVDFDYSVPLYEDGKAIYEKTRDENGELRFYIGAGEGNGRVSLIYKAADQIQEEREAEIDVTKKAEIEEGYVYQYATMDGETFDYNIPLYKIDGEPIYGQEEDADRIAWFFMEEDGVRRYISLVYEEREDKQEERTEKIKVTEEVEIEEKYAYHYQYATQDGEIFDFSKPLYEKNGEPIYSQEDDGTGVLWFYTGEGVGKEKLSLVYEFSNQNHEGREGEIEVTKKEGEEYVYQYATKNGEEFDYSIPLYDKDGNPLYTQEKNDDGIDCFFIENEDEKTEISYVYDADGQMERTEKIKVTERVEEEKKYAFQYATKNGEEFDFSKPLYGAGKPIYIQEEDETGELWFYIGEGEGKEKLSLVYEFINQSHEGREKEIEVTKKEGEEYVYQYATKNGEKFDYSIPLYDKDGNPLYTQEKNDDGIDCFFIENGDEKTEISHVYDADGQKERTEKFKVTERVEEEKKYAFLYATLNGEEFDFYKPLYEAGKPIYIQEEDETGELWFYIGEGEGKEKLSLVYESSDQSHGEREGDVKVTKKAEGHERYVYRFATLNGEEFDYSIPLYDQKGDPIYRKEKIAGISRFFIENENGRTPISLVYEEREDKQEERTEKLKVIEKVELEVGIEKKYAFQYATKDGETFDYSIPLYEGENPIYDQEEDENKVLWFFKQESEDGEKEYISLVYETRDQKQEESEIVIEVTNKVEGEEGYLYQYVTTDGKTFDYGKPLYNEENKPIYGKPEVKDGAYWFFIEEDGEKRYISLVYETEADKQEIRQEEIKLIEEVEVEKKYAYQYAVEDKKIRFDKPLYEGKVPIYKQYVDKNGVYWFLDNQNGEERKYPVYDTTSGDAWTHVEITMLTKKMEAPKESIYRYTYQYATKDGIKFDFNKPLYEDGKPIYTQYVDKSGKSWFVDKQNGTGEHYLVYDTESEEIRIYEEEPKISLKEKVIDKNIENLIEKMRKEKKLSTAANLYTGAVAGRILNGTISGVIQKTAVDGKFVPVTSQSEGENKKEESFLYTGGIAGRMGTGAIVRDCYITKQVSASEAIDGVLKSYVADITGTGVADAQAMCFIIDNNSKGTVSGDGEIKMNFGYTTSEDAGTEIETIKPETFAQQNTMENWKYFPKDVTGENDVYTLKWLFRNNGGYSYRLDKTAEDSIKIDITVDLDQPGNSGYKNQKGALKYLYRPSIDEGEKETIKEITETKDVSLQNEDLEDSGYLLVRHIYYTDGKYYYYKEFSDEKYIYPYMEGRDFSTSFDEDLVRENMQDYIQVYGNMSQSGSNAVFYYITNANKFPVKANREELEEYGVAWAVQGKAGNEMWEASVLFDGNSTQLIGFWTLDEKIYPVYSSRTYDESDRQIMEAPEEFSISRYYKDDGSMSPFYARLPIDQGRQVAYAGQNIRIHEYNEESLNRKIEYLCLFSTEEKTAENEQEFRRAGVTYTHDAASGTSNLSIPESYNPGDEFYLHILKIRKGLASGLVTLEFKMNSINGITPSKPSNAVVINGTGILLDVGQLDGKDGILGIRYLVSNSEQADLKTLSNVNDITIVPYKPGEEIEIILEREDGEMRKYLYVQYYGRYDNENICGQLEMMEYAFADKTGSPSITPDTIMFINEAGVLGAFTCYTNTRAELNAAAGSTIIYCSGESETTELSFSRVRDENILSLLAEKTQKDQNTNVLMERLYVQSNGLWYQMSEGAEVYKADEGIMLSNPSQETKYIHIGAVAFEENKEPSDSVHYVYEVEPQEETAAPAAVLYTSVEEPTVVSLHTSLFFQSITPDAEIYYTLDGTVPGTTEGGSTKKYDTQKGILVEGEYSGLFRVNLVAVKKDSNGENIFKPSKSISFVYKIGEQDSVLPPTSIPATSEENPTVLPPGKRILLNTDTKGAVIYYTVDGTEPKVNGDGSVENGSQYDEVAGILMPEDGTDFFTIRAIAVKSGMENSPAVQLTFCYPDKVLAPYASPASGVVDAGTSVTLENATEGATIYYEIDYENSKPKEPTITSAVYDSEQPFIITKKTTIKAIAVKDGVKSKVETFTYNTSKLSDAPIASIASGSVVSRSTFLDITSGNGSTIYYTTDGSDPTDMANTNVVVGQTLLLDGEYGSVITVKACAKAADKAFSEVLSFTYQISMYQGGVTSSLESGAEVSGGATVNLMSDISNARIYYTIDGTNPSAGSAAGTAVTLNGEPGTIVTVKAMAIPEGVTVDAAGNSTAIFNYKIKDTITGPEASPAGGTLTSQISVTLTAAKGDIYYTTDGSIPTINSTMYTEPITVNKSMEIKAIAATKEGEASAVSTFTYNTAMRAAKPMSSVEDGVLEPGTVVDLSSQTSGAVIYYSTDGTEPNMENLDSLLIYDGMGITVKRTVSIQAAAYKDGYLLSNPAAFHYEVADVPAAIEKEKREAEEAEKGLKETDATGLGDKRSSSISGPAFTGIILKETDFNTMVSAEEGIVPEKARLVAKEENCKDSVRDNLKALLGEEYEMLSMYDMSIYEESKSIRPGGELEIGIPIPEEYENAALQIVYVDSEGNIKIHETRRSDGMAYAITDHFSLYGLAGVKNEEENKFTVDVVYLVVGAALMITVAGAGFFFIQLTRKKRRKGNGSKKK